MSKKETLIREYFALRSEFDNLIGSLKPFNSVPTEAEIKYFTGHFKIIDLEDKIDAVSVQINELKKKQEITSFYASEYGESLKKCIENDIEKTLLSMRQLESDAEADVEKYMQDKLGVDFKIKISIGGAYICYAEIGLKNTDPTRKFYEFEFGHSFNIYYYRDKSNEQKLEMNYGTVGNFDLLHDINRMNYLVYMGVLVGNGKFKEFLMNVFEEIYMKYTLLNKKLDDLRNKLNNPL